MARVLITEPLSEDGLAVLRQEPGLLHHLGGKIIEPLLQRPIQKQIRERRHGGDGQQGQGNEIYEQTGLDL